MGITTKNRLIQQDMEVGTCCVVIKCYSISVYELAICIKRISDNLFEAFARKNEKHQLVQNGWVWENILNW